MWNDSTKGGEVKDQVSVVTSIQKSLRVLLGPRRIDYISGICCFTVLTIEKGETVLNL